MMMPSGMGMPNFMGGMVGMGGMGGMAGMGQPMPFNISGAAPQGSSAGFFPLTQNNQK